jgi:hypothetical protein
LNASEPKPSIATCSEWDIDVKARRGIALAAAAFATFVPALLQKSDQERAKNPANRVAMKPESEHQMHLGDRPLNLHFGWRYYP